MYTVSSAKWSSGKDFIRPYFTRNKTLGQGSKLAFQFRCTYTNSLNLKSLTFKFRYKFSLQEFRNSHLLLVSVSLEALYSVYLAEANPNSKEFLAEKFWLPTCSCMGYILK